MTIKWESTGDEVRKLAHDLAAPISNLRSLINEDESDLISRNIKDLEIMTNQVLGKYNADKNCEQTNQDNLHIILSDLKEKFEDKIKVEFKLSMEFDWYSVDATLFTRTFTNLITNSIKANATKIGVKGYFKNKNLTIEITDNGSGIPKAIQPYIFEKGITSNKTTGNGLGLSFIRECFIKNGFRIQLSKSDSKGTIFQIQIPLDEIILIDDNPLVRDTWTTLAKKLGIQIKAYSKGKDIELNQIQHSTPIFVDLELENENGLDTYTKLTNLGFSNVLLATGSKGKLGSSIRKASKSFPFDGALA